MNITERLRQLLVLRLLKMDARTFHKALATFGSVEGVLRAKKSESTDAVWKAADKEIELASSSGVRIVTFFDEDYPALLKEIFDPPTHLYIKGELPANSDTCLAVVGSREASVHGLDMAHAMGRDLAAAGAVVVSGLARGIDSAAHRGALEAKGRTVAVLGCGLSRMYPPENKKLSEEIAKHGAVVSEFPMKEGPKLHHFPMRNRIISGLSRALVVVEAREKSGALITVGCALEQGREVYALPGNAGSKKTLGSNGLLKQGAALVTDASDILLDFGLVPKEKKAVGRRANGLSAEERALLRHLDAAQSLQLDEIVEKSALGPQKAMALLTALAVKGAVRELPGKYFLEVEQ